MRRTAAPSFRGMSATDSEGAQNSSRVPSERVADLRRNQWPEWVGIRTNETNTYDRDRNRA
jgi:hypothetical protein